MATSTSTPNFDRSFYAAYNLMMMLTCTVLNNENIQYEAFTAIIKVFGTWESFAGWDCANSQKSDPMSLS